MKRLLTTLLILMSLGGGGIEAKESNQHPRYGGHRAVVSWYGDPQKTATGARYNPQGLTAAHKSLPMGTKVRFTNPKTRVSLVVTVNDRGPYIGGREFDLSTRAASILGMSEQGVAELNYEVVGKSRKTSYKTKKSKYKKENSYGQKVSRNKVRGKVHRHIS